MQSRAVRSRCRDGTRAAFVRRIPHAPQRKRPHDEALSSVSWSPSRPPLLVRLRAVLRRRRRRRRPWTYCGVDGYYDCDGDDCDWVSPTLPRPGAGAAVADGGGFECQRQRDCAAGCYCAGRHLRRGRLLHAATADCADGLRLQRGARRRASRLPADRATATASARRVSTAHDDDTCTATCSAPMTRRQSRMASAAATRRAAPASRARTRRAPAVARSTCNTVRRPARGSGPTLIDGCYTGDVRGRHAPCDVDPGLRALKTRRTASARTRLRVGRQRHQLHEARRHGLPAGRHELHAARAACSPALHAQLTLSIDVSCSLTAWRLPLRGASHFRDGSPMRPGSGFAGVGFAHGLRVRRDDGGHDRVGRRAGQEASVQVRDHGARRRRRASTCERPANVRGVITAPPRASGADAEGTITIRPLGQRIIRYELSFLGDDGKRYEMVGQKDIRWRRALETFTTCPPRSSTRTTAASRPA